MTRCQCIKVDGKQCTRDAKTNSVYCWQHQKCKNIFNQSTQGINIKEQEIEKLKIKQKTEKQVAEKLKAEKEKINPQEKEKLEIALTNFGKNCEIFDKWTPLKLITHSKYKPIIQICNSNDCNFAAKFASLKEAEFSEQMGKVGLSPQILDISQCEDKMVIVAEKFDGDVSEFFYPPHHLNEIIPQVLDLIYQLLVIHGICHNDTAGNNFLWKKTDYGLKVYVTDYSSSDKCQLKDIPKSTEKKSIFDFSKPPINAIYHQLDKHLNQFIESFIKPGYAGINKPKGLDVLNKDKPWLMEFLSAIDTALKKDKHWINYYPNGIMNTQYAYHFKG